MIKLFRKIRQKLLTENKFGQYLIYASGEIVLVVIGILIAIQINDWNRDRELYKEELKSYQLIISDLKRDSSLFEAYHRFYSKYMDSYFMMNEIRNGQGSLKNTFPDHLVSVLQFNPITQKNHQIYIEKYRNVQIRNQINNYFQSISQVEQATDEFNKLISEKSRPFFLEENNVFDNGVVFHKADRTFPPLRKVSALDTVKLKRAFDQAYFLPILSELRMSLGFYLASLERSMDGNHQLIEKLEASLK